MKGEGTEKTPGGEGSRLDSKTHTRTLFLKEISLPIKSKGLPRRLSGKESACQCRKHGFDPWVKKIPWRKKWQSTPVFSPGKSHGQKEPGGLHSMGSQRVRHDCATELS